MGRAEIPCCGSDGRPLEKVLMKGSGFKILGNTSILLTI